MKKEESQTKRKTDKYYNQIVSLEDRMESIEKETKDTKENIEMIIRAELLSKVDEILEERTENLKPTQKLLLYAAAGVPLFISVIYYSY